MRAERSVACWDDSMADCSVGPTVASRAVLRDVPRADSSVGY